MTFPLVFRDPAIRDVRDAEAWYEAQVPGLGGRFSHSLHLVVTLVSEHHLACTVVYRKTRRALLPGFPFALFCFERVAVRAPFDAPNTDAIDLGPGHNFLVRGCDIDTGDDAIVVKRGAARGGTSYFLQKP